MHSSVRLKSILLHCALCFAGLTAMQTVLAETVLPLAPVLDPLAVGATGDKRQLGAALASNGDWVAAAMPTRGEVLMYRWQGSDWALHSALNVGTPDFTNQVLITALALDGEWLAVGMGNRYDDSNRIGEVAVYRWQATEWVFSARLQPAGLQHLDAFGHAVGLAQDRLVVGAPGDDDAAVDGGAVYVYSWDGLAWQFVHKTAGSDTGAGDAFGSALAMQGVDLVVGSPLHNDNAAQTGTAHVLAFDGAVYQPVQKLPAPASAAQSRYGDSVAIAGDLIAVGASDGYNDLNVQTGSVHDWQRNAGTWSYQGKVFAGVDGAQFGAAVDIRGQQLLVAMPDSGAASSGAFVYQRNAGAWQFDSWLQQPGPFAVSQAHDTLLLGTPLENDEFNDQGRVHVFSGAPNNWQLLQSLDGREPVDFDGFGSALSLFNDRMLVGVQNDANNGIHSGSARMWQRSGDDWQPVLTWFPADGGAGDAFGAEVLLLDGVALVAAPHHNNAGGAVYEYEFNGVDWVAGDKLVPLDNAANDRYGQALTGDADWLMVASAASDANDFSAVYVYNRVGGNWVAHQTLLSGALNDGFGEHVQYHQNLLYVGVPGAGDHGQVWVYALNAGNWTLEDTVSAAADWQGTSFGGSFAVDGDALVATSNRTVFIGAGYYSHSVYMHLFTRSAGLWSQQNSLIQGYSTNNSGHASAVTLSGDRAMLVTGLNVDVGLTVGDVFFFRLDGPSLQRLVAFDGGLTQTIFTGPMRVAAAMDGDRAYAGHAWQSRSGLWSGGIEVYDTDPPDVIFVNGLD